MSIHVKVCMILVFPPHLFADLPLTPDNLTFFRFPYTVEGLSCRGSTVFNLLRRPIRAPDQIPDRS